MRNNILVVGVHDLPIGRLKICIVVVASTFRAIVRHREQSIRNPDMDDAQTVVVWGLMEHQKDTAHRT